MNVVIRASVVLAVAVTLVIVLIAVTGLHQKPAFSAIVAILLFTLINIAVIFWGLSGTAAQNGYLKQLGNAAMIGLLGAILIAGASWTLTSFVFPDYLDEAAQAAIEFMESAGLPEDQIERQSQELEKITPANQAVQGAIGTLLTSLVAGAIIAIWKRKK